MIERDMIVICVHGDGDREHVNRVQASKNANTKMEHARNRQPIPPHLDQPPDQPPDVLAVLRDEHHHLRLELPLLTWDEVEEFKAKAGFDMSPDANGQPRRHWKHGAIIKVRIG